MASVPKMAEFLGAEVMPGFMLRYIYFLDPSYRQRLTVPEIPYSKIWEVGAGMYKGEKCDEQRAGEAKVVNAPSDQLGDRGFESHPPAPENDPPPAPGPAPAPGRGGGGVTGNA